MIPVRGKAQSSIMHHKFAIVDSRKVIHVIHLGSGALPGKMLVLG